MSRQENWSFSPDFSESGQKSSEGEDARWTWFSPADDPEHRLKYAVIEEKDGILSIQPDEGRFRKGLAAWRYASEDAEEHTVWVVVKVRPNRIDLVPAPSG